MSDERATTIVPPPPSIGTIPAKKGSEEPDLRSFLLEIKEELKREIANHALRAFSRVETALSEMRGELESMRGQLMSLQGQIVKLGGDQKAQAANLATRINDLSEELNTMKGESLMVLEDFREKLFAIGVLAQDTYDMVSSHIQDEKAHPVRAAKPESGQPSIKPQ